MLIQNIIKIKFYEIRYFSTSYRINNLCSTKKLGYLCYGYLNYEPLTLIIGSNIISSLSVNRILFFTVFLILLGKHMLVEDYFH